MISFSLEKRPHARTGALLDTIIKREEGKPDDEWCNTQELDELFEACVARWGSNWDLNKVKLAISEAEFD